MTSPRPERLFLALWPDPRVRRALGELARTRLPPGLGRPVPAANLHLTLVFLGAVEAAARTSLEAACASIAMRPVRLELDHLGCWPRSRVAWTAPTRTPPALARLVEALREAAAACAIPVERRPFAAHVTLARRIPPRPTIAGEIAAPHPPLRWHARRFSLVRSVRAAGGPRYEPVATWPGPPAEVATD